MNVHDLRSSIDRRDEAQTTAMLREIFCSSPTASWPHLVGKLRELTTESQETRAFVERCSRPIFPHILMHHLSETLRSIAQSPRSGGDERRPGDAIDTSRGKA